MALTNDEMHVKTSNARRMWRRQLTGKVTGAKTGWQQLTFIRKFKSVPEVVVTPVYDGTSVHVRNITEAGFQYSITGTPSGSDPTFCWRADEPEMLSSPLVDEINGYIGTSFSSLNELLGSASGMASVATNENALNTLLNATEAYRQVSSSQNAVNALFSNNNAFSQTTAKTALLNQIKASEWGYAKWWIRSAGETDVSNITTTDQLFGNDHFQTGCQNETLFKDLVSNASRCNRIVQSGRALWIICKSGKNCRVAATANLKTDLNKANYSIAYNTLKNSPDDFKRVTIPGEGYSSDYYSVVWVDADSTSFNIRTNADDVSDDDIFGSANRECWVKVGNLRMGDIPNNDRSKGTNVQTLDGQRFASCSSYKSDYGTSSTYNAPALGCGGAYLRNDFYSFTRQGMSQVEIFKAI